ncbi:MAG: cob(I)yrinic acid a,c-diamide adenosyltransferase [Oscillospiraceae bacterium]|nr:cob(I)yrinic acid a,c-diamide adenosyltransferase [Oscillospiraceae bacterium]
MGLIHIYYGDGKGKTTAAFGLALRCAGYGRPVVIAQFLKARQSGELLAAAQLPQITILRAQATEKFTFQMDEAERLQAAAECRTLLQRAEDCARETGAALLVLDEVLDACDTGLLDYAALFDVLARRDAGLEIVMTGHSLLPELADYADYISHMQMKKHPFTRGIAAREGIEY